MNGYLSKRYPIWIPSNGKELWVVLTTTLEKLRRENYFPSVLVVSGDDYLRLDRAIHAYRHFDILEWDTTNKVFNLQIFVVDKIDDRVGYLYEQQLF